MTIYELKEIISGKYNRKDTALYNRAVLFVIQNTVTGEYAIFQIDRISKKTASLRCNNGTSGRRTCGHRLSLEHSITTEAFGKGKGRRIADCVTKMDLLDMTNWMKVFHDHTRKCKMVGSLLCDKTEHKFHTCTSKTMDAIIGRKYRSFCIVLIIDIAKVDSEILTVFQQTSEISK